MADNQAQQIMKTDAYHPQGMGGEWLGTQLPTVPVTSELGTITNEGDDTAHRTTGGMTAALLVLAVDALIAGAVGFALGWMVRS